MKYTKLAVTLFAAGMLLLSGCGSSNDTSSVPVTETPPSTETPSASPVLESTTITTTNGKVIRVDRTAGGLIF